MLDYHPEALKFPKIEGAEREALKKSLKRTKGNKEQPILYRVYAGRRQGLDGINREELCNELKIKPTYKRVTVPDDEVKEYIWRRNLFRRHLTAEQRKPFVDELAANGFNNSEIAKTLGVDEKTVRNDRRSNSSGKPGVSSDNSEIKTKLVDELKSVSFSPKILPFVEALPVGKQKDMAKLIPLHGISKAYQMVADQREAGEEAPPKKAGKAVFAWKEFDASFGTVVRAVDEVASVYGDDGQEKDQCLHALSEFRRTWTAWRKRLTKSSV